MARHTPLLENRESARFLPEAAQRNGREKREIPKHMHLAYCLRELSARLGLRAVHKLERFLLGRARRIRMAIGIPAGIGIGAATVTIGPQTATVQIATVAPGLFTLNSAGLAAAYVVRVGPGNVQTVRRFSPPRMNPVLLRRSILARRRTSST
jgi:hypothetical protein